MVLVVASLYRNKMLVKTPQEIFYSAVIREASSCNRWKLMQRPITRPGEDSEKPWKTQY